MAALKSKLAGILDTPLTHKIPSRVLASVAGYLNSLKIALPWAGALSRALFNLLGTVESWSKRLRVNSCVRDDLQFVLDRADQWNGSALLSRDSQPCVVIGSDASLFAYSGWIQLDSVSRARLSAEALVATAQVEGNKIFLRGEWTAAEAEHSINVLEAWGLERTLRYFCELYDAGLFGGGRVEAIGKMAEVVAVVDNTTAQAYVNKGGGRQDELAASARRMWRLCLERGLLCRAARCPGSQHTLADQGSRVRADDEREYELTREAFEDIVMAWGAPDMDRMATLRTRKVAAYMSRFLEAEAVAVNCFSEEWRGFSYCYHPACACVGGGDGRDCALRTGHPRVAAEDMVERRGTEGEGLSRPRPCTVVCPRVARLSPLCPGRGLQDAGVVVVKEACT